MIHYHGTPITPDQVASAVLPTRHAMVSFAAPQQVALVAEICQSFALDNGAFTAWKRGKQPKWREYYDWVEEWMYHPGFDWALIPDVIDGDESANDSLIAEWPHGLVGVPVWHMHESVSRLMTLGVQWPRVAIGSSGDFAEIGTHRWWIRMSEAMEAICDDDGRPKCKLHGLRMLDPTIFSHLPFSSADSTNVARNSGLDTKWRGPYQPLSEGARALVLADRIERHASARRWSGTGGIQKNLELVG